jgi:hypothetical protein
MTILVSAFPGIGKSYATDVLRKAGHNVSDSDSSLFPKTSFPQSYLAHIKTLIEQGNIDYLFISSHKDVREGLEEMGLKYYLMYPDPKQDLKEEFMERYIQRGSPPAFLELMSKQFEIFVESCAQPTPNSIHIPVGAGEYLYDKLADLVS